ncbi:MAG: hypothetical protein Q7T82_01990 [Armatimonadota bacterium]|nr:hypothetical protein [Armatimonadota bacterium]
MIFDSSTLRPLLATYNNGGNLYDSLQWGPDASTLYAIDNELDFDFFALKVNASGVVLDQLYAGLFTGFRARIHFDPGTKLLYGDYGEAVDPVTALPEGNFFATGRMVPDSKLNRAYLIMGTSIPSTFIIKAFDLAHFNLVDSIKIDNINGYPHRLIRWGTNELAFTTNQESQVYLGGGNIVH